MPLDRTATVDEVELLLPDVRCAGCIGPVETALAAVPGVLSARVNLTAKRAKVEIAPAKGNGEELVSTLVAALERAGFTARPFDRGMDGGITADQTGRDLLIRIGVAGFAAMNVMLLSVSVWSGAEAATRDLLHLDLGPDRTARDGICWYALLSQRTWRVGRPAPEHGRADFAGDHAGGVEFADRDRTGAASTPISTLGSC